MSLNARDNFISTKDIIVFDAQTSTKCMLRKGTRCRVTCFVVDWNSGVLWTVHFEDEHGKGYKISSKDEFFKQFELGIKIMKGELCFA